MSSRIELAVDMLREGKSFKVGEIVLSTSEDLLHVKGFTQSLSLDVMSQASALKELDKIKELFGKMISESDNLDKFTANKDLEFILIISAGMSNQPVCREHNGEVVWEYELQ